MLTFSTRNLEQKLQEFKGFTKPKVHFLAHPESATNYSPQTNPALDQVRGRLLAAAAQPALPLLRPLHLHLEFSAAPRRRRGRVRGRVGLLHVPALRPSLHPVRAGRGHRRRGSAASLPAHLQVLYEGPHS